MSLTTLISLLIFFNDSLIDYNMIHLNSITEVAITRRTLNWGDPKILLKNHLPLPPDSNEKMTDPHLQQGK